MQQPPMDELLSESVSVRLFPTSGRLRIHWKVSSGIFLYMEDKQNYHYFLFPITLFPFYINVSVTTIGYRCVSMIVYATHAYTFTYEYVCAMFGAELHQNQ